MDNTRLKSEIEHEIKNLERLVKEMDKIIKRFGDEPDFVEIRAAGSILHDFYCGVEKIFERIALYVDGKLPECDDWHRVLLQQMGESVENSRGSLISENLLGKFKEYLRFRHLFRHTYGFELKWERFKNLSLSLPVIFRDFKENIREFMENLDSTERERNNK